VSFIEEIRLRRDVSRSSGRPGTGRPPATF